MSYGIKTLNFEITSTTGCDFVDAEIADTVTLTGWLEGVGVMTPQDGPLRVRLEVDVFTGWCPETGERLTVRWVWDATSRMDALMSLRDMVNRVMWAAAQEDETAEMFAA